MLARVGVIDEVSADLGISAAWQVTHSISDIDRPSLGITPDCSDHAIPDGGGLPHRYT